MLSRFWNDRRGAYGMMIGVMALPMLLGVGMAVDFARLGSADKHLQELSDIAALAMATSRETNKDKLTTIANDAIAANLVSRGMHNVQIENLDPKDDAINLKLKGELPTLFMSVAGVDTMKVSSYSQAMRGVSGSVEVSLVLDNTWSMSEADAKGVTKIAALKTAAKQLVEELHKSKDAPVRIGLVPYADYVNVGTANKAKSWLDLPAEYDVQAVAATCETKPVTSTPCVEYAAKYACTKYVDGVAEASTCGGQCTKYGDPVTKDQKVCSGGVSAASYRWFGCVGSRKTGTSRLDDGSPTAKYPGFVTTSQKCLNPIVPLTNVKKTVTDAIDAMIINIGTGYKPNTYIPAGLVWGLNQLSPDEPFAEAAAYDTKNLKPRKVMILMTDGENTLRFVSSNGTHTAFSGTAAQIATQTLQTKNDTLSLCTNIKAKKIELFTIAFSVDDADAKSILETCASDKEHYYDAKDAGALASAFSGIVQKLSFVRLSK